MSAIEALRVYAFVGLPVGLATGLALGLVARAEDGWGGYGSFRRRAARLGHVALVMLPLIAGFYALALEGRTGAEATLEWAARLWIVGGAGLGIALHAIAWRPAWKAALPIPALAVTAGAVLFALAAVGGR